MRDECGAKESKTVSSVRVLEVVMDLRAGHIKGCKDHAVHRLGVRLTSDDFDDAPQNLVVGI